MKLILAALLAVSGAAFAEGTTPAAKAPQAAASAPASHKGVVAKKKKKSKKADAGKGATEEPKKEGEPSAPAK